MEDSEALDDRMRREVWGNVVLTIMVIGLSAVIAFVCSGCSTSLAY